MRRLCLVCGAFTLLFSSAAAKIVGAYILPHGGIALNPSEFKASTPLARQWAWQIHRAAVEVGRHIRSLKPQLILLSTPHGVADSRRFVFYLNANGSGSAETDNCSCPPCCYKLSNVRMAANETASLVSGLETEGHSVTGTSFFGPPGSAEPAALRWGEVIPLLFVKELSRTKVMVLSQPWRRYNDSVRMIPELIRLGASIYDEMEAMEERVILLISGDLAHTHEASGPYGYSPSAEPFDEAMGAWAASLHPYYLLDSGAQLVDSALSCGYTGFVLLQGALQRSGLHRWSSALLANHHPSYYGMMVAAFHRKPNDTACAACQTNRSD